MTSIRLWLEQREALRKELTKEEYEFARSTTLNAHYTSPIIIGAMYRALERFGFQGGAILEPACGVGHFIGLMPEDILRRSTITGIEIDPLTARIAKALYPDADIRAQPFEQIQTGGRLLRRRHFQRPLWRLHRSIRASTPSSFPSTIISSPPRWRKSVRAAL